MSGASVVTGRPDPASWLVSFGPPERPTPGPGQPAIPVTLATGAARHHGGHERYPVGATDPAARSVDRRLDQLDAAGPLTKTFGRRERRRDECPTTSTPIARARRLRRSASC